MVAANDTVTFSGMFANHPLVWTAGDFATKSDGTSQQFAFPRPGTHGYYCLLHGDATACAGRSASPATGIPPGSPSPPARPRPSLASP